MRPTDKATGDSRSVQSFVIIKNTGDGNFVNGCFHTRARNGLSARLRLALNRRPLPHRHPFSDFFLGEGAAVHRLSETDNRYPNCPSKLTDKVRWIVHSKLISIFKLRRITYLTRITKRITRLTQIIRL